jgi:hypothetical protein
MTKDAQNINFAIPANYVNSELANLSGRVKGLAKAGSPAANESAVLEQLRPGEYVPVLPRGMSGQYGDKPGYQPDQQLPDPSDPVQRDRAIADYERNRAYSAWLSEQRAAEREFDAYNDFYYAKDEATKLKAATEFVVRFPSSQNAKAVNNYILYSLFHAAVQSYYQGPDGPKLDKLVGVGEEFLKRQPDQPYVTTDMALASGAGVLRGFYKDIPKASGLADKAVALLEPTTPPQGFKPDEWNKLRSTGLSTLNQYKGLYLMRQEPVRPDEAIAYFNKAAEMKEGPASQDPNTYYLRATAYDSKFAELRSKYRSLPDTEKIGDSGKAILAKVDLLVDKIIEDSARVYVLSTKPELKGLRDTSKKIVDQFWKDFKSEKLHGLDKYLKQFERNPTAPHPVHATARPTSNGVAPSDKTGNTDTAATRPTTAKTHPNFAGTWSLDKKKSEGFGSMNGLDATLTVTQDDNTLTTEGKYLTSEHLTYKLDGSKTQSGFFELQRPP